MQDVTLTLGIDGAHFQVSAHLPDQLRTAGPNGAYLYRAGQAWRLDGETPQPATATDLAWLQGVRDLVDAAALGPFHRLAAATRSETGVMLREPSGASCRVQFREPTALVQQWDFGGITLRVLDVLRTKTTWMTSSMHHPELGEVSVAFERSAVVWSSDFFAPPPARVPTAAAPSLTLRQGAEPRSATPVPWTSKAMQLVILDDPGDWAARAAKYQPIHAELERQGQKIAGFPMLFVDGTRRILAAPFRRAPNGPELQLPHGWEVRDWADQHLMVVYPAVGDFAARCAAGELLLQQELQRSGGKARGPVVAQPFFHLQDGPPEPEKLLAPTLRMTVAIENP